nr:immunoglobulin heavy chain junction region [Mus musculus]
CVRGGPLGFSMDYW